MDRNALAKLAARFADTAPENYLSESMGVEAEYIGLRLYERPIFKIALASDPDFAMLKREGIVGPHFKPPKFWLPEAKTVISFFFPHTGKVKASNAGPLEPSREWLYSRIEGQQFLCAFAKHMVDEFRKAGIGAVAPVIDPRYTYYLPTPPKNDDPPFNSNWSERHVAYICRLGTFGLSTCIITEKGCAGRLVSVVTDWDTAPDSGEKKGLYDNCIRCGVCIRRCPAKCITEDGKDKAACASFVHVTCQKYYPRYGCGKCQTKMPCQDKIPAAALSRVDDGKAKRPKRQTCLS